MQRLEQAVAGLEQALASPIRFPQSWRHIVRQRLANVCDALSAESAAAAESWLSARSGHLRRERDRLLARLGVLASVLTETADLESARANLLRVVADVHHHQQRISDLAYDSVAMEVGGSE